MLHYYVVKKTVIKTSLFIRHRKPGMVIAVYYAEVIDMTYECVVKKGHTGAGSYSEAKLFIKASNIIDAMNIARNRGGVKKGRAYMGGQSVISIKTVAN